LREGGDCLRGFVFVLIERKARPSGESALTQVSGRDEPQAMLFQLHVTDDVRANGAGGMRERGAAEAGMKFIGDGRAADLGRRSRTSGLNPALAR
jgi:hypothetical protein